MTTEGGPPPAHGGLVARTALVDRLTATADRVVALLAPAGYGKTTLLIEWAEKDSRPFAWVALDDQDKDPSTLLLHVARELDHARPDEAPLADRLSRPRISIRSSALPLLTQSFRASREPLVLAFDDIQLIDNVDAIDSIAALAENLPPGSVVALAGRGEHGLPLARLSAQRRLDELGHLDLALDPSQARLLLRSVVGEVGDDVAAHLLDRTEGWPVGLYLAGLALAAEPDAALAYEGLGGDDRSVRDYVRTEILARLPEAERLFLTRSSVLPSMCGALCDAVLDRTGSQGMLESIERANHLLVPLDRRHHWFRYHDLFREALGAELVAHEPDLVNQLRQAAIQWFSSHGQPEHAFEQAMAMGDVDQARELFAELVLPVFHDGRVSTLVTWIDRFGEELAERDQRIATVSAWAGMVTGNAVRAERWGRVAQRAHEQSATTEEAPSAIPYYTFRAHLAHDGVRMMVEDATRALDEVPEASPWRGPTLLIHGIAMALVGEIDRAEESLEAASDIGVTGGALMAATMSLAWRATLAISRNDWVVAERLNRRSRELVDEAHLGEYPFSGITFAVAARIAAHRGDSSTAAAEMVKTQRLLPLLTRALPWIGIQTRVELGRASLERGDMSAARVLLLEIDEILHRVPDVGRLVDEVTSLRTAADVMGGRTDPGVSSLTTAELRLMPYLPTHLSFREIGERLFVSENTVKTQAGSIYRKLGASSRSEAVDRAEGLGLVGL